MQIPFSFFQRTLALLICALTLCTGRSAFAWTCSFDPADSNAVYVGAFLDTVDLAAETDAGTSCSIQFWYCVWLTGSGTIDYVLDVSSMSASGDCDMVDSLATRQLFNVVSWHGVMKGAMLGYSSCGAECPGLASHRAVAPSCVERTGNGSGTSFAVCEGAALCMRTYRVCCKDSLPTVTLASVGTSVCNDDNCDGTCSEEQEMLTSGNACSNRHLSQRETNVGANQ